MSNSERHHDKRRQRAKQKHKECNMRTFKRFKGEDNVLHLVPKKTVPGKSWLRRLGSRIKALWPGGKTVKEGVSKEDAQKAKEKLEAAGAVVEIQ